MKKLRFVRASLLAVVLLTFGLAWTIARPSFAADAEQQELPALTFELEASSPLETDELDAQETLAVEVSDEPVEALENNETLVEPEATQTEPVLDSVQESELAELAPEPEPTAGASATVELAAEPSETEPALEEQAVKTTSSVKYLLLAQESNGRQYLWPCDSKGKRLSNTVFSSSDPNTNAIGTLFISADIAQLNSFWYYEYLSNNGKVSGYSRGWQYNWPQVVHFLGNKVYDLAHFPRSSRLTSVVGLEKQTNLITIPSQCFYDCGALSSIKLPPNITQIGSSAFKNCIALTSVSIPSQVTSIGDSAFKGCTKLAKISLPARLTSIGAQAFENCVSLKSVTIPKNVRTIGYKAFGGCTKLSAVYMSSDPKPSISYGFRDTNVVRTTGTGWIYVPANLIEKYRDLEENYRLRAMNDNTKVPMYRLYNPNSGEHFYTASAGERDSLRRAGWRYEGVGWNAPKGSGTPVYRLYNKNAGDHHYTTSAGERDALVKLGWRYEGIGWYSDEAKGVALYRQYNPNARTGTHNYTTSKAENDYLVRVGWRAEGIGWYGLK